MLFHSASLECTNTADGIHKALPDRRAGDLMRQIRVNYSCCISAVSGTRCDFHHVTSSYLDVSINLDHRGFPLYPGSTIQSHSLFYFVSETDLSPYWFVLVWQRLVKKRGRKETISIVNNHITSNKFWLQIFKHHHQLSIIEIQLNMNIHIVKNVGLLICISKFLNRMEFRQYHKFLSSK